MSAAPAASPPRLGQVYRCRICGAELTVLRASKGELTPRCCNRFMDLKRERAAGYFCSVCGSELIVIHEGQGELKPRCCNREMVLR